MERVVLLSYKKPDSHININVDEYSCAGVPLFPEQ